MSILCRVDDKFIPLYRILWVSAVPHYCGEEDCVREGYYEVRLEQGESVWANTQEQQEVRSRLDEWQGGLGPGEDEAGDTPW